MDDHVLALVVEADIGAHRSSGASATWNGPSTVLSEAPEGFRLLIASTSIETPVHVREEDELLAPFVAHLAGLR